MKEKKDKPQLKKTKPQAAKLVMPEKPPLPQKQPRKPLTFLKCVWVVGRKLVGRVKGQLWNTELGEIEGTEEISASQVRKQLLKQDFSVPVDQVFGNVQLSEERRQARERSLCRAAVRQDLRAKAREAAALSPGQKLEG